MGHLTIEGVTEYADFNKLNFVDDVKLSYPKLMERFLSYHKYRWALPFKRKWWRDTYNYIITSLVYQPDAPDFYDHLELLVRKNQAYGVEPLLLTGLRGIAIRCLSKSSRLVNLKEGANSGDEAITDTLVDLLCYCILALMMIDGRLQKCVD